jgi:Predicted protein-tyrosine phosphatase
MILVRSANSNEKLPSKGVIFIGDSYDALDVQNLKRTHITGIINCAAELPNSRNNYKSSYLKIDLFDVPYQDILSSLSYVYEFIEENLLTGNVLVHCVMGISRSVSLVIGYLMLKFPRLSYNEIYDYIKTYRKGINPNTGFRTQLLTLDNN